MEVCKEWGQRVVVRGIRLVEGGGDGVLSDKGGS